MEPTQAFRDKVIAITGAASGIGLATAHYLAVRGATVSLADIQQAQLDAASTQIREKVPSAKVMTAVVDVRDHEAVDRWIASTISKFGSLDGAANLAGVFTSSPGIVDLENEQWDFVIGVNLTGVMYCLRAQMRVISTGGSIVNASSVAGLVGSAAYPAYVASKHGVVGLTKSAAKEMGTRGVRVNAICPGRIATPMMDQVKAQIDGPKMNWETPIQRMGTPDEVAALIAFLLGDESRFITGSAYTIDGGKTC